MLRFKIGEQAEIIIRNQEIVIKPLNLSTLPLQRTKRLQQIDPCKANGDPANQIAPYDIQILDHNYLKADRNNLLRCPFHNDKTPSLQIYPQTNTYCCFHRIAMPARVTLIEFIRLMERTTKHEAILKTISMITPNHAHAATKTDHAKLFKAFEGNLKKNTPGGFNTNKDEEVKPMLSEYDVLNRTLKSPYPTGR